MKRLCRGVKLGVKLVRAWGCRCTLSWRRRLERSPYHRLTAHEAAANTTKGTVATKLLGLGRSLSRRLCNTFPVAAGGEVHDRKPLLNFEDNDVFRPPPKGHLVVYVGGGGEGTELRRYLLPVVYVNHPFFGELLRDAKEEYGFQQKGGITIPCAVSDFEDVRARIGIATATPELRIRKCGGGRGRRMWWRSLWLTM